MGAVAAMLQSQRSSVSGVNLDELAAIAGWCDRNGVRLMIMRRARGALSVDAAVQVVRTSAGVHVEFLPDATDLPFEVAVF